jgi:hypothetical protein
MNLLSVSTVTRLGSEVTFELDHCRLSKNGKTIITATRHGSLYRVNKTEINDHDAAQALSSFSDTASKELSLWHSRLGHLNVGDLRKLVRISFGISETLPTELNPSLTCMEGKMTRRFHRDSTVAISDYPFTLVHSDSCRPFRVPSIASAK